MWIFDNKKNILYNLDLVQSVYCSDESNVGFCKIFLLYPPGGSDFRIREESIAFDTHEEKQRVFNRIINQFAFRDGMVGVEEL